MNRQQYDELRKRVERLEHKLKDSLDDHAHPDARKFKDGFRKIEDDLQVHKNPRSIESDVRRFEQTFVSYANTEVLSQQEMNFFADEMRSIIQQLRKFDNY